MKWIGITGGIATGKSTVSKMIQDLGGEVIDADLIAREVVVPGSFGLRAIVQLFGKEVVETNSTEIQLDRPALGKIIFQDPQAKLLLERILHPLIQWRSRQERLALAKTGLPRAFYDAALIFEKNLKRHFDYVVLVSASPEVQKNRLVKRDGISAAEADRRIQSQMPLSEKVKMADFIIDNDGDKNQTRKQVEEVLKKI